MAYSPPMMLPILVPTMTSMGMPVSSMTFNAPMCAVPLAPPPLSTIPTRGLSAGMAGMHSSSNIYNRYIALVI